MGRFLVTLILIALAGVAHAERVDITDIRTWSGPDHTRVVLDLSRSVNFDVFSLDSPRRVVVDIRDARMGGGAVSADEIDGVLRDIRTGRRNGDDLRVVFDLSAAAQPEAFTVKPNDTYGHRLVVDLERSDSGRDEQRVRREAKASGELVVAIDAGHGGEDPGAVGPGGTYEKDVVLEVARELKRRLDGAPGLRPVLIREGDYYIGLRERTRKARAVGADMFVSVHADAVPQRNVRGGSVYILSRSGASSEVARTLAREENEADRIGGVSLEGKDDMVASVLVDLSRAATIESSSGLASSLIERMDRIGRMHSRDVERAAFVVLKSLDMPSVLVELAFISNPVEAKLLRSGAHQRKLARALARGIEQYAAEQMPRLRMARAREYTVQRGDTLSDIAREHGVSVSRLRRANELSGDTIVAGTTLRIP